MTYFQNKKVVIISFAVIFALGILGFFFYENELRPVSAQGGNTQPYSFEVKSGEGFREIVGDLKTENLIRSRTAFYALSFFTGSVSKLKPGVYQLRDTMSSGEIMDELVSGSHREVTITILEGASVYDIDKLLSGAGVLTPGSLAALNKQENIEGTLFPDTYKFFADSDARDALKKFEDNFGIKAAPLLAADRKNWGSNLILASIVQKEVPNRNDEEIVAGILGKRLAAKMPLQVDATICYIKEAVSPSGGGNCYPLSPLDFKIDSAYNTYLYGGLPPGPIGNPGVVAIQAVLHSKSSPYWFYLSDPKTGKTMFARTLDEQSRNKAIYLK